MVATVPPCGGRANEALVCGPRPLPKMEMAIPGATVPATPLAALITPVIVGVVTAPTCRVAITNMGLADPDCVMLIEPL